MTEIQKAWLAGFIDGEGTFTVSHAVNTKNKRHYYRRFFTITNTDKRSIDFIVECFGGKIYNVKTPPQKKPQYSVRYHHHICIKVIEAVLPYLLLKRQVALEVLNFPERKRIRGSTYRDGFLPDDEGCEAQRQALIRIRQLNQRGNKTKQ